MAARFQLPSFKVEIVPVLVFVIALMAAAAVAAVSVARIEKRTAESLEPIVIASGETWARIIPDGILIRISGEAPDQEASQRLARLIGSVVSPDRIVHESTVAPKDIKGELEKSRFIVLALRDGDQVSLGGLIGSDEQRRIIHDTVRDSLDVVVITDMLIDVQNSASAFSSEALGYGLTSLELLPRSSVMIEADRVTITAALDSEDELKTIEPQLAGRRPESVQATLDLRAPATMAPTFEFRATRRDGIIFVDGCTAASSEDARRILDAVERTGSTESSECEVALGSPHPEWADVVIAGIEAMTETDGRLLRIANTSIVLVVDSESDRLPVVKQGIEDTLPDLFSLQVVQSPADGTGLAEGDTFPGSLRVTLNADGTVLLEGDIADDRSTEMIQTYAQVLFGTDMVDNRIEIGGELPGGWPVAVFSGLEALELLRTGTLTVTDDSISITGTGLGEDAPEQVARLLSTQARDWGDHVVSITYSDEEAEPEAGADQDAGLDPRECEGRISAILADEQIIFSPGRTSIEPESADVIDAVAAVLAECPGARFEVEGHTDSSGNAEMNRNLSLIRAEYVIGALIERGIITSGLSAKGYGEEFPIADNSTPEGQQKNRRIAFRLLTAADGGTDDND
ncbi:MAG: OmpA family protein [Rhodobacteraceae bacterium]|nr:OmpA family protein [Paracoccaceae bacterium]MCY4141294.1 OmpA family protein [Paracoccaceae bacterium]